MFDKHGLPGGGGDIIVTLGETDYNEDGVRDVLSIIVNDGEKITPRVALFSPSFTIIDNTSRTQASF